MHYKKNIPIKQNFPIILSFALLCWASLAFCYTNLQKTIDFFKEKLFGISLIIWILLFSLTIIAIFFVLLFKTKISRLILIVPISISIGICLSFIAAIELDIDQNNIFNLQNKNLTFEIIEDQKTGNYTNSVNAKIKGTDYSVKVQIDKDFEELHAGDIINSNAKFSKASESQEQNFWQNGLCVNANLSNPKKISRNDIYGLIFSYRNYLIKTIRELDPKGPNALSCEEQLLNAIICGQRIDLNTSTLYNDFKCAGLAHLVAVSGAHLSLVTAILLVILKKLKLKRWLIVCIQSIFIFMYLICAAVPISALRAALMAYIAIFSFFGKRRPASLNALGVCIVILIGLNPQTSVSVSFALSAASTLGIILFSSLFEYYIIKIFPKCPDLISGALSLTFAANLCSQPFSVSIFNQLPLISPISNIICTPIFSALCGCGLISSIFCSIFKDILPAISNLIISISYFISKIMCIVVSLLANFPYASIPASLNSYFAICITIVLCFFLYKFWPKQKIINNLLTGQKYNIRIENSKNTSSIFKEKQSSLFLPTIKKKRKLNLKIIAPVFAVLISFCFFIFIFKTGAAQTQLLMLDVAQGDSILLKSKGKNFMIDTGNQDTMLKQRLAEQGISHLDGLMITHPDDDHCGSLDVIQSLVEVDNIYLANDLFYSKDTNCSKLLNNVKKITPENKIQKLNVGNKIQFGEICLEIIWPDKYNDNGGNEDSLCVLAKIDIDNDNKIDATALLCGDAEHEEIDQMQKSGRLQNVDIYKCGHHGSKNAISENSLAMLAPKITLISVGAKNRYGHPAKNIIEMLEKIKSQIYRTDEKGTITLNFYKDKIDINTSR